MPVQVSLNLLAILVAAVASMVIGFLWYGPLFGKALTKPVKLYLINTLHYLVTLAVMGAILAVWV